MNVKWVAADSLLEEGRKRMLDAETLVDIGCGIQPQKHIVPDVHICFEPFEQYVDVLLGKIRNEYDRAYVVVKGTWEEALQRLPRKSVDTVFILDVIEHLDKAEGERLLKMTEGLAKRQIVIFTPLGFMPQCHADGKDAWNLDGGAWQEHKSGWMPEDFGKDWEFVACEDFHKLDHAGVAFPKPYGAFWAFRTFPEQAPSEAETRRRLIHAIRQDLVTIRNMAVLQDIAKVVGAVLRVKSTPLRRIYKETIERLRG